MARYEEAIADYETAWKMQPTGEYYREKVRENSELLREVKQQAVKPEEGTTNKKRARSGGAGWTYWRVTRDQELHVHRAETLHLSRFSTRSSPPTRLLGAIEILNPHVLPSDDVVTDFQLHEPKRQR